MSAQAKPVLTYFNGKGRAEPARVILAEAGVDFVDNRLDDITPIKDKLAFGQVPLLEHDGLQLVQSMTICRYLARLHGLYGRDVKEGALADMIVDVVNDLNSVYRAAKTDEQKATLLNETLPKWLGYFEKLLGQQEYFVPSGFTYADIMVYLLNAFLLKELPTILDKYPALKAHHDRVASRPRIAHWIKTRPQTNW